MSSITPVGKAPRSKTPPRSGKSPNFNSKFNGKHKAEGVVNTTAHLHSSQNSSGRTSSAAPFIELYQREGCLRSHRVRKQLSELGLDFVSHSVPLGAELKHAQLARAGGRDRIPFLIDHRTGTKLYEAGPINMYLEKQYRHGIKDRNFHDSLFPNLTQGMAQWRRIRQDLSDTWNSLKDSFQNLRSGMSDNYPSSEDENRRSVG